MTSTIVNNWTLATSQMPWGVQSAFKTALQAVAEGDIKMVYGQDVYDGSPCLVNAISNMVSVNNQGVSPTGFAPAVVRAFDAINRMLETKGINKDQYVSPFAAEILLQNFGADSPKEIVVGPLDPGTAGLSADGEPYYEKSDDDLMKAWLEAQSTECPAVLVVEDENNPAPTDFNFDDEIKPFDLEEFNKVRTFILNDE